MADVGLALFDTAIGPCGIAWRDAAIAAIALPERTADATRARLVRRYPDARDAPPRPRCRSSLRADLQRRR
jgi:methylated-DNA-[protein]-cysteine S-methyltransferase